MTIANSGRTQRFSLEVGEAIVSTADFLKSLFALRRRRSNLKFWYRGHGDNGYSLIPSVGRRHSAGAKTAIFSAYQERELLHRFRRRAYPHVGRIMPEWEALFLARHHRLPTRILDWTANPLVALYFTCAEETGRGDGDLWAFEKFDTTKHDLDVLHLASNPNSPGPLEAYPGEFDDSQITTGRTDEAIKVLHPFYNSPRMVSQDGAFTLHSNPRRSMDMYADVEFHEERLDIARLYRWPVPGDSKSRLLEELNSLSVNRRLVFPDLDGVAQSLVEAEILWRGGDATKASDG